MRIARQQFGARLFSEWRLVEECEHILDDRPLRQGDVFEWVDEAKIRPWSLFGVVVTADCDLARGKTRGVLSYVPILPDKEYFWTIWRHDRLGPAVDRFATESAERVSRQLKKRTSEHKNLSPEALKLWISRVGADGVVREMGLTDNGQIKDFTTRLSTLADGIKLMETQEPDYQLMRKMMPLKSSKASPDNYDALIDEFRNTLTALPGDTFFFSHLPGSSAGGHFAMLRYISQCAVENVAINQEQLKFGGARARRIARMSAPYLYAMTQGLGRVFTDIGLPTAYEEKRLASLALLKADWETAN